MGTKFTKLSDHSLLATASSPPISTYSVTVRTKLRGITAFRLEVLADPNLPHNGPGRTKHGNFVLTDFSVDAMSPDGQVTNLVALQNATADFSQNEFPVGDAITGKSDAKHGWAVDAGPGLINHDRRAVFETKENIGFEEGPTLVFTLKQRFGVDHSIGGFRLSATTQRVRKPIRADPLSREVRESVQLLYGQTNR